MTTRVTRKALHLCGAALLLCACNHAGQSGADAGVDACTTPGCSKPGPDLALRGPPDLRPRPDLGGPIVPDYINRLGPGSPNPFDPKDDMSSGVRLDGAGDIVLTAGIAASDRSVIWVANSGEGSVSKIDTRTLKEIARYYTYPGAGADPSRTTVGISGDVVVANRAKLLVDRASVMKIAGNKSGCIDRNKNGKIDTFEGAGPVPAQFSWLDGQAQSPDECVLWLTDLHQAGKAVLPRASGFNAEMVMGELRSTQVYIGLYGTSELLRLDAQTGAILKRIDVSPAMPYGLVLDKAGTVWVRGAEGNGSLVKVDPHTADQVTHYDGANAPPCPYGIATDAKGFIYTAGPSGADGCVSRFDPVAQTWQTLKLVPPAGSPMSGQTYPRGLAVDRKGGVWIADTFQGLFHVDASGASMVQKGMAAIPLVTTLGAAVDADGSPWAISFDKSTAYKVDPVTYATQPVVVGQNPYTYSDMTGSQLRGVQLPQPGVFRHLFTGCSGSAATRWISLDYTVTDAPGSHTTVRMRSAATAAALATAPFTALAGPPPIALNLFDGTQFLEVEFDMTTTDLSATPVLSALSASYDCLVVAG